MSNTRRGLPLTSSRIEKIFPKLTPAPLSRIATRGYVRSMEGAKYPMSRDTERTILCGYVRRARVVRPSVPVETLITVYESGQFTGEVGTLSGRRSLFRVRVTKPGKVIELNRQQMLALVQTDAELGEVLIRAFILRRVELIAAGVGDIVLIGSTYSASTLRIKGFLMRNGQPYSYIDLERDPDVQNLLDSFQISPGEIPVLICRGQLVCAIPLTKKSQTALVLMNLLTKPMCAIS